MLLVDSPIHAALVALFFNFTTRVISFFSYIFSISRSTLIFAPRASDITYNAIKIILFQYFVRYLNLFESMTNRVFLPRYLIGHGRQYAIKDVIRRVKSHGHFDTGHSRERLRVYQRVLEAS